MKIRHNRHDGAIKNAMEDNPGITLDRARQLIDKWSAVLPLFNEDGSPRYSENCKVIAIEAQTSSCWTTEPTKEEMESCVYAPYIPLEDED